MLKKMCMCLYTIFYILTVLYVGLTLGIAVQIQNIGEGFFHQPLLFRLDAHAGCQINDTNKNKAHMTTMNEMKYAVFSTNWQPGVPKYNWVNWQWEGFTNQNIYRHSSPEYTFSKENY